MEFQLVFSGWVIYTSPQNSTPSPIDSTHRVTSIPRVSTSNSHPTPTILRAFQGALKCNSIFPPKNRFFLKWNSIFYPKNSFSLIWFSRLSRRVFDFPGTKNFGDYSIIVQYYCNRRLSLTMKA